MLHRREYLNKGYPYSIKPREKPSRIPAKLWPLITPPPFDPLCRFLWNLLRFTEQILRVKQKSLYV